MPETFVEFGKNTNLSNVTDNGSTFGTISTWKETNSWAFVVGVLVEDAKTFNIFPPSGQAVIGDHLMIPQGATISSDTDTIVFGETVEMWFNGASWQMTKPIILSDFMFGKNNAAGYFDLVPANGEIPNEIVSSGVNLSIANGTFGNSSTWNTAVFPGMVGVLASATNNFQIFPSGTTPQVGDVITIPQGATIMVDGYCVAFGETVQVTFNGTTWEGLENYETPSTPMTITGIDTTRTVYDTANGWYGIYVTTNVVNTGATWGGWDNSANVSVNGTATRADWCFASDVLLYVQVSTADVANPITIAKGTKVTINGILYEISEDFNLYHYDGGFYTEVQA